MDEIEEINGDDVGDIIRVDLDELIAQFVVGQLTGNEIRLIIVPDEDDNPDDVRLASSEFVNDRDRPNLNINYTRTFDGGPLNCYPDDLPNNFSDETGGIQGGNENKIEACGFVTLMSSQNRDLAGIARNPDRLGAVIVPIELIGQASRDNAGLSGVEVELEFDEADRIDGVRFQAGWYDFHDGKQLNQPPLNGLFGKSVSWIEDQDLDGRPEIIISAPRNELDVVETINNFGPRAPHVVGRPYTGSIIIFEGQNFDSDNTRDKQGEDGTSSIPTPNDERINGCMDSGTCDPRNPFPRCGTFSPGVYQIFAETPGDMLGGARSGGDVNLDSVPDFICGAPKNDRTPAVPDTGDEGAFYVIFGRSPVGNIRLELADDPTRRSPMIRVRGETPGDGIGWKQEPLTDVNGDGIDDVAFSSPMTDFILSRPSCEQLPDGFLSTGFFNSCFGLEVAVDDFCKPYDFDNDRLITNEDRDVLTCLISADGGRDCCPVDNGYVGILFGGVTRQGDRTISQLGTNELPGIIFYGTNAGDRAGHDISSAGDFDNDGFGDLLIVAPGEKRIDNNGRERMGVTYLVFGGPHLQNREVPIELSEIGVTIPGIVFMSAYETGGLDEAPTDNCGVLGDINNDGFSDIAIGITKADLLDDTFPQGDGDANSTGRRPDQGDAYIIYGNNVNR